MQGCRLHGCPNGGRAPTGALRARRGESPQSLTAQGSQNESAALVLAKPCGARVSDGRVRALVHGQVPDPHPAWHYRNFHGVAGAYVTVMSSGYVFG